MVNSNGSIAFKIITICIIPVLFFMGTSIINNDKDSRDRDIKVKEELVTIARQQQDTNQDIKVMLAELKMDMNYLKAKVK